MAPSLRTSGLWRCLLLLLVLAISTPGLAHVQMGEHAASAASFSHEIPSVSPDAEPADTVSVIEVSSGKVVDTIRTGMGAHGVVLSSDGAWAFITNIVDGTVSAIDVATGKVVAGFSVGRGPNGITYRPPQG